MGNDKVSDSMEKVDSKKLLGKTEKAGDGKQPEKIMKSAKEEREKKSDEKGGSNQDSKSVVPAETTE